MASDLQVVATGRNDDGGLEEAIADVVAYLEHLERCWSRFLPSSDVSRLNRIGEQGGRILVDPSTTVLLQSMIEGHRLTDGRFDPTRLRALIREGYEVSRVDPTKRSDVPPGETRHDALSELVVDVREHTVDVPAGLVVDPGGIGKGLAADLAVARLLRAGSDGAMVSIGGDLAMAGEPIDPAGWIIEVENAEDTDDVVCRLAVSGGGVATSSRRSRRWMAQGEERHHQIDPRTNTCAATDLTAVTVIAPSGWLAEVHATAALVVGGESVLGYLEHHGLSGLAQAPAGSDRPLRATSDVASTIPGERITG